MSIVNIATINNDEFSDNRIQDIYSGNDSIPNITAINVRSPKSIYKNKMSNNFASPDFNVQTSEIPCSKIPDIKIAQNVSNISNEIMYANITDESKAFS